MHDVTSLDIWTVAAPVECNCLIQRNAKGQDCWTNQLSTDIVAVVDTVLQLNINTFNATALLIFRYTIDKVKMSID